MSDVFVGTTLLSAYGKCGIIQGAEEIFTTLPDRNLITWNALLSAYTEQGEPGYTREGNFVAAECAFKEWILAGFNPDDVTFTTLLSTCSHAGLVEVGTEYFELLRAYYHLPAEPTHYVCMVDLLGRAGVFSKVENILRKTKVHNVPAFGSCLMGACCTHSNYELVKLVFLHASKVYPEDTAAYVLMSNMYSSTCGHGEAAGWIDFELAE
ncbi:hypothetical protein L7F22_049999 [Adiantum nelumboides]|nr:hypothetical protein [Adiantum nelumboides]